VPPTFGGNVATIEQRTTDDGKKSFRVKVRLKGAQTQTFNIYNDLRQRVKTALVIQKKAETISTP
jgi:hypothetical protein